MLSGESCITLCTIWDHFCTFCEKQGYIVCGYICVYIYTSQIHGSPCFWGGKEVNGSREMSKRHFNFIVMLYLFKKKKKWKQIWQKVSIYWFLELSTLIFILCSSFVFSPNQEIKGLLPFLSEHMNLSKCFNSFLCLRCTESQIR